MSSLRLAGSEDALPARDLVRRAFAHYVPRIGSRPRPMDEDYAALAARGELWVRGDPVAGVVVLQDAADHLWVDVVAVDPEHRGTGFGGELMRFAEAEASRRGHREVRLLTHELMHENLGLYAHLGYEEYDRQPVNGSSLVYLRKVLDG